MNENTVYFSFHGNINPTSATNLIYACNKAVQENKDHIYISFSSGGGVTESGFFLYNTLKALDIKITFHNTGSAESAGFVTFLAGDIRLASEASRFLIHQPMRKFPANVSYDARDLSEFSQLLESDQLNTKKIFSREIRAPESEIDTWFKLSKIFIPSEAQANGIVSSVCDLVVPKTHNLITISTEQT